MLALEMSPAVTVGVVSVLLLIAGLGIMVLSNKAGGPSILATIFWWLGLLVAILGAVLLLAPIISWIAAQLKTALGL